MTLWDELLDQLLDCDSRKAAVPKPRYFYGERGNADEDPTKHTHYDNIPEEQFWNPNNE